MNDRPFFDSLGVLIWPQKDTYFAKFADRLVKVTDLDDVQNIFCCIFFVCRTENRAILESVNEGFKISFGLGGEEDEGLFGGEKHNHFAIDWIEVFVVKDVLP